MAQRNEELQFAREECIAANPEIVHQNDVAIAEISGPLITFPPLLFWQLLMDAATVHADAGAAARL
jgi:hypothetical protein